MADDNSLTGAMTRLREELVTALGSEEVYFQPPPEFLFTTFPCITFKWVGVANVSADNLRYLSNSKFQLVLMTEDLNIPMIDYIISRPLATVQSIFTQAGVYHVVCDIYNQS